MSSCCLMIFCLVVTVVNQPAAQTDSCFNLMDYSPPAFNYHLLEFTPNIALQGNIDTKTLIQTTGSNDATVSRREEQNNHINPTLDLNGRHQYYGWQGRTEWTFSTNISLKGTLRSLVPENDRYNNNSQNFNSIDEHRLNGTGSFSAAASYYFRWPFFIGAKIVPELTGKASRYNSISKDYRVGYYYLLPSGENTADTNRYTYSDRSQDDNGYTIGGTAYLRAGAGHLDDVSFAVAAMNMLDNVAKIEKSYNGCNDAQVQKLAALIEKMRKRRAFDSRIAFIENIDTLCSYIRESGMVDSISPRSVLELADQWEYVFYQKRTKGIFCKLYPQVSYFRQFHESGQTFTGYELRHSGPYTLQHNDRNEFSSFDTSYSTQSKEGIRTHLFSYGVNVSGRYERPLSRYLQLSLQSEAAVSINRRWSNEWDDDGNTLPIEYRHAQPFVSAGESATFACYPNTRTSLSISESVNYLRRFGYRDIHRSGAEFSPISADNEDYRRLILSLSGNSTYYISPQLQFTVKGSIHWEDYYNRTYGIPPWQYETGYHSYSSQYFYYYLNTYITWKIR
jgi:hypothetical protein